MTSELTAKHLASLRTRHHRSDDYLRYYGDDRYSCFACHENWPCDVVGLLATIDARDKEIQRLEWLVCQKDKVLIETAEAFSAFERRTRRWDTGEAPPIVTKLTDASLLTVEDAPKE